MASDVGKFHFRLVLLGSNRTGKTSILNRFLFKKFEVKYKPTVEDLFSKDFDLGSIEIKVDFLDTSGSMQFPAMRRLSITTGSAFLIVYSVDDESSFDVLKMCVSEIQEIRPDYQEIPIVFAGNKCDTPRADRKVTKDLVSNYVYYELPRLRAKVIECSCKENVNIDNIFKSYLSLAKVSLSSAVSANLMSSTSGKKRASHVAALPLADESSDATNSNNNRYNTSGTNSPVSGINHHGGGNNKRSSSIREALGVRKSCDASIASSLRKMSISAANHHGKSSREQLATMREGSDSQIQLSSDYSNSATTAANNRYQQQQQHQQGGAARTHLGNSSDEVFIKDAIQQSNKLTIDQGPKPRSRSLIWRPHRKSSRASSNESNECRVS